MPLPKNKADALAVIAQHEALLRLDDIELGKYMSFQYGQMLATKRINSLPGRFRRMIQRGTAHVTIPQVGPPDAGNLKRFREGLEQANANLKKYLLTHEQATHNPR